MNYLIGKELFETFEEAKHYAAKIVYKEIAALEDIKGKEDDQYNFSKVERLAVIGLGIQVMKEDDVLKLKDFFEKRGIRFSAFKEVKLNQKA